MINVRHSAATAALAQDHHAGAPLPQIIEQALRLIRIHLQIDVAFVSDFVGDRRYFPYLDGASNGGLTHVGGSEPREDSHCDPVADGGLPQIINGTVVISAAVRLSAGQSLPAGAHLGVPIRLRNGRVFGKFCCFSVAPHRPLDERDLQVLQVVADIVAYSLETDLENCREYDEKVARIRSLIEHRQLSVVYQPIYRLQDDRIAGVECLSRFSSAPSQSPDKWFSEAAEVGLGVELELAAIRIALAELSSLRTDIYIALNASPETILSGRLPTALEGIAPERLVIEITEHVSVHDYEELNRVLRPLRKRGLRVAVDDAGAGFASLRHVLHLKPDMIKLDVALTRNINKDPSRRSLAAALIAFAKETGSRIVAEGVETAPQLDVLRSLGAHNAQGYLMGKPMMLSLLSLLLNQEHM